MICHDGHDDHGPVIPAVYMYKSKRQKAYCGLCIELSLLILYMLTQKSILKRKFPSVKIFKEIVCVTLCQSQRQCLAAAAPLEWSSSFASTYHQYLMAFTSIVLIIQPCQADLHLSL